MIEIEFLGYKETPAEKYLGIATVRIGRAVVLKYRINQTKDGQNIFPAAPSYKEVVDGQDKWNEWFMVDSRSQHEDINTLIKEKVRAYYAQKAKNPLTEKSPMGMPPENPWGPSDPVFDQQTPVASPPSQPNPNYHGTTQPTGTFPVPPGWSQPAPPPQNQFPF
jgi:hypothetical protein